MLDFDSMTTFQLDVRRRLAAAFGGIKVASRDAPTVLRQIRDCVPEDDTVMTWTTGRGLWRVNPDHTETAESKEAKDPYDRAESLGAFFRGQGDNRTTLVLFDFDEYIRNDPRVRRFVIEAVQTARQHGHLLVLLSRHKDMHDELADEVQLIVHELPDRATLRDVVTDVLADHEDIDGNVEGMLDVLGGLTSTRAADAVAFGVVDAKIRNLTEVDLAVVRSFKEKEIARMPGLDLVKTSRTFEDVVGLASLKRYLKRQLHSLSPEAADHGVDKPKGIMLAGEPGTGKSVTPEAFAHEAGWLMFKLDPGSLRGKFVGDTETNTDAALAVISANTPCVVLVDEVERFFGNGGGDHDGGVGERLTGKLLSWAAQQAGAFLVFTSNNPMDLPAALVRKGRLDTFFHVGTPDREQREAIWRYYLGKAEHALSEEEIQKFVDDSEQWVGSEIEAAVGQARKTAWAAYVEEERASPFPTAADVEAEVRDTVPHAETYSEQVQRMRAWAEKNAKDANDKVIPASPAPKKTRARRVSI